MLTLNTLTPTIRQDAGASPAPPTREEAEAAIRTLIRFAGDDPSREGLRDTPGRVARAYGELFAGYAIDPIALLERTFEEVDGYDQVVLLRDIRVESYCEHHMSATCRNAGWSASASWHASSMRFRSACKSRSA